MLQNTQVSVGGGVHKGEIFNFQFLISNENLLLAWREFKSGKTKKKDVQEFELRLMDNILALHAELANKTYEHGGYHHFRISDPKPRDIHKASVRDRLVHHAIYRILYPYFDKKFISDSYSCRIGKGTHKALNRFRAFAYKVSKNHTRTAWVLKCDIKKFFANIDHKILLNLLCHSIVDKDILWLLKNIISSFSTMSTHSSVGLPQIAEFLRERLRLTLHPDKTFIQTYASGADFLGWVHFTDHRVLRTASKRRMFRRLQEHPTEGTVASYCGLLSHGNTNKLKLTYAGLPRFARNDS